MRTENNLVTSLHYAAEAERWHADLHRTLREQNVKRRELAALTGHTLHALGRRLRRETPWSIEDYGFLSARFDLRPLGQVGHLRFAPLSQLSPFAAATTPTPFDPDAYLAQLAQLADGCEAGGYEVAVYSSDLPIFYFFGSPLPAKVKLLLFTTNRTPNVLHAAQRNNLHLFQSYEADCQRLAERYLRLQRQEIWGPDPLGSFCHQLERLARSGLLKQVDLAQVAEATLALVETLAAHLAEAPDSLAVRIDQERAVPATYLLRNGVGEDRSFLSLDNPQFVTAADPHTTRYLEQGFERNWQRSHPISVSAPARVAFFEQLRVDTERRMRRLVSYQ